MKIAPGVNSPLTRLLRARGARRRIEALKLADSTLRKLRGAGVSLRVIGALSMGNFRVDSDIKYLVEDRGGLSEFEVIGRIEKAMGSFPLDVIFAERMDPELSGLMREEAKHRAAAQDRKAA